jgi:hypothetical protein
MTSSRAFITLRENLRQFVHPDFKSKLSRLVAKLAKPKHQNSISESFKSKLNGLISELDSIPPSRIRISYQDNSGFSNRIKIIIEDLTKETWEWWPLKPRMRPLPPGQAHLHWDCVSCRPRYLGAALIVSVMW